MKRILLGFALLVFIGSCSTDFKIGADYKEITAVYGLLDASVDSNYIKISRGFFSETENNLLMAQREDSLYFKDLTVTIDELSGGNVNKTYTLQRVDLAKILDQPKQAGVFLDSPNYAYLFNALLSPTYTYRLKIVNNETGKIHTSTTDVIGALPSEFQIVYPYTKFDPMIFEEAEKSFQFAWNAPKGSSLFDVLIRFHYVERYIPTNTYTRKYVDLPVAKFIKGSQGAMKAEVTTKDFYSLLNASIDDGGTKYARYVDTPDLKIIAGGSILKLYIDINSAQSGLTSDQIRPVYTNIGGGDALGIFSTRATRTLYSSLFSEATFDSIIGGSFTRNLNFVGRSSD